MAHHKSAIKRIGTSREARAYNRVFKSKVRTAMKKVRLAGDKETAKEAFRTAASALDSAARRRIIHPNAAARHKSRLAKLVNVK